MAGAASHDPTPTPPPAWVTWGAVGALVLLGMVLTLVGAAGSDRAGQEMERLRFTQESAALVKALENSIAAGIEEVLGEGDFVRSHADLSRQEFATFTAPAVARLPQVRSMTWIEAVPAADREAWEAALRSDGAAHGIQELDGAGGLRPAGDRPMYYPVRYIEPRETGGRALGFDAGSSPERRAALERARDTGQPVATPIMPLVSDPGPRNSVVLFVPVYHGPPPRTQEQRRERLRGFTTAGFHVRLLLEQALRETTPGTMRLHLFDVTEDRPQPVLSWPTKHQEIPPDERLLAAADRGELAVPHDVTVAGRKWRIIATPGPRYTPLAKTPGWIVAAAGLSFTALAAVLLVVAVRRNAHLRVLAQARADHAARLQAEAREREAAQRALSRANDELRQLNTEMEQFVSAVSHDLKNPLLAIDWTTVALRKGLDAGQVEQARQRVETLGSAVASMRQMIDDLITHARAGWSGFDPVPVDLGLLVRRVVAIHAEALERAGMLVEVEEALPKVCGDPTRLTAAVDNLVSNAVKYGSTASPPRLRIGCVCEGDEARLFVADNGPGVPADQRQRVFQFFHRAHDGGDGTGIGLAIVERVARAHRGRVWVDDAPGGGARFWLVLPLASEPAAPATGPG